MLKNMPTDIILKIQSFLLGEPHLYRIQHNPTLKAIQDKYKIYYTEPQVGFNIYGNYTEMYYQMRMEDVKPHMINKTRNVNRIVNFINHYQYGIPEDYDDDDDDDVETEEINLDNDVYEEVEIDDDNQIKVEIDFSLRCKEQFPILDGEIFNCYTHHKSKYLLGKATKKLVSKALRMFVEGCQRYKRTQERRREENEHFQFDFTYFEIQVFIKSGDETEGSSGQSRDDSDSEED